MLQEESDRESTLTIIPIDDDDDNNVVDGENERGEGEEGEEGATYSDERPSSTVSSQFRHIWSEVKHSIGQYTSILFKNRKFFWLFSSGIVSVTGTFLSNIAIMTVVNERTSANSSSGLAVSAVLWCIFIPPILLMPFTGVVADLFDRRKVMLISDLARAFLVLLFLLVSMLGQTFYILYVVLFVVCALNAFFDPSKESLVPVVIRDKSEILIAKSIDSLTWMFCSFVGSSVGGAITSLAGPSANFIVDSATFFVSAFCVFQLLRVKDFYPRDESSNSSPQSPEFSDQRSIIVDEMVESEVKEGVEEGDQLKEIDLNQTQDTNDSQSKNKSIVLVLTTSLKTYFKELLAGFKFLFKNPYLFSLCLLKFSGSFAWGSLEIVSLKYSDIYFRIGKDASAMFGISKALSGIASGLVPVMLERTMAFILRYRKQRKLKRMRENREEIRPEDENLNNLPWNPNLTRSIIVMTFLIMGTGFFLIYMSAHTHVTLFLLGHLVIGTGSGLIWTLSTSSIFLVCPNKYMGRTMSVDFGFFLSISQILSVTLAGIIFDRTGSVEKLTLFILCLAVFMAILWGIWAIICRNQKHETIQLIEDGDSSIETQEVDNNGEEFVGEHVE